MDTVFRFNENNFQYFLISTYAPPPRDIVDPRDKNRDIKTLRQTVAAQLKCPGATRGSTQRHARSACFPELSHPCVVTPIPVQKSNCTLDYFVLAFLTPPCATTPVCAITHIRTVRLSNPTHSLNQSNFRAPVP